jgi:thiosulfate/3-mercaptopyruvate sulfurtransferase
VRSALDNPPLVSCEWLASRLSDPVIAVLDIRPRRDDGAPGGFEAGHIPGAVQSDYGKDGWRAAKGLAIGMLPDAAALSALFSRLGLRPDHHVVIVPAGTNAGDFSAAARVFWTLRAARHKRLAILDGGFSCWASDPSRPIETGPPAPREPSDYPVVLDERLRADIARVEEGIADPATVLLDARGRGYFEGCEKSPQAMRAGRLPGALHLDQAEAYDAGRNRLKSLAQLERLFSTVPDCALISFCNTGQAAATNWFVLCELLHRPDVRLYDGSMSEWTQDATRPVETGASRPSVPNSDQTTSS